MHRLIVLSASEQAADFLKKNLLNKVWQGVIPGGDKLAAELGVGRDTMEAALRQLEQEGLLKNQGPRKPRLIVPLPEDLTNNQLRIAILIYELADRRLDYIIKLEHEISEAGHRPIYPKKCLLELGMDTQRVIKMVQETEADGWIIIGGTKDILKWFLKSKIPAMALFGRWRGLSIAAVGPSKAQPIADATKRLIDLGHSRIVYINRRLRRLPKPGTSEQSFLDTLAANGITPSPYHMPDWEETVDGLYQRLESLFQITPPTAMIIDEVPFFIATQQFLANKRLCAPEDVSLICTDYDDAFEWCRPKISHIQWDSSPVVRRIVKWVNHVKNSKADFKHTHTPAEFVEGETIGPAKG